MIVSSNFIQVESKGNSFHASRSLYHRRLNRSVMKQIIQYSILLGAFAAIFTACSKDNVEPTPDTRFPLPLITKDTTGDVFIPGQDPASFLGKFIIDMYYGTAVTP